MGECAVLISLLGVPLLLVPGSWLVEKKKKKFLEQ